MSKTIAITTLLICGTAIVVLLLVGARLYKNTILKLLSCFFALLISAGTIFGTIALSHISEGTQSNSPYTNFHGVTPLSPPPNVISLTGSNATTIVSLRGDTGAQRWHYTLNPNNTIENITLNDNSVYSIVNNSKTSILSVLALRADNGHRLWYFDLTPATYPGFIIATSSPTIANNILYLNLEYVNNSNGLCAFHTNNGSLLHCQSLNEHNPQAPTTSANDLQGIHTVELSQRSTAQDPLSLTAPIVNGNVVLVALPDPQHEQLQAFAGDTLLQLWSYQLSVDGSIIGANEFFYIHDIANQQIDALQPTNGKLAWTISIPGLPTQFVKPILTAAHIYLYESHDLQGTDQTITAFDLHTGKQNWQEQLPMRIDFSTNRDSTPIETDHTLYIILPNNTLTSLDTDTGRMKSKITIDPLQIQNTNCSVTNIVGINVQHNVLFLSLQYANLAPRRFGFFNIGTSNNPCNNTMSISAISPQSSFAYWDYIYHDQSNQNVPILLQNTLP